MGESCPVLMDDSCFLAVVLTEKRKGLTDFLTSFSLVYISFHDSISHRSSPCHLRLLSLDHCRRMYG